MNKFEGYKKVAHSYYKYETTIVVREATGIIGRSFTRRYLRLDERGILTISVGYMWNGASGPTIDTANSIYPSLIHDALYQALREKLLTASEWRYPVHELMYRAMNGLQKVIDRLFLRLLKEHGMCWLRRTIWYLAVRTFGYKSTLPEDLK